MADKVLMDALEQIGANQKRALDKVDNLTERVNELEQNAKPRSASSIVLGANLRSAIPDRMRGMVDAYARMAHKDPERAAACEAWLKNHLKMQVPGNPDLVRLADENRRLAEALGGETRAYLNENTGAQGAFGVPTAVEREIFSVLEDSGRVRHVARKIPLSSKSSTLVNLASNVTSYVVSELGASITQGEPTFGSAVLTAKDYVAYGQVTIDVFQDEAVGLLDFFGQNAAMMIGAKEDNLALEGTTTDTVVGLGSQTTTNVYTIGKIYYQAATTATNSPTIPTLDLLSNAVFNSVPKSARLGTGAWFMRPGTWGRLIGQTTSSLPLLSTQIWWGQSTPTDPLADGMLLGYPVYVTPQIGTVTAGANIYFGDFSNMIFGDRTGVSFQMTDAEKFQYGLISLRVIKRTGIAVANPSAFSVIAKCSY